MAIRPVFVPCTSREGKALVVEVPIDFIWHPGMAISQKQKNIVELHKAYQLTSSNLVLEVSTKSNCHTGVQLSAFNLMIDEPSSGLIPLESAFQGSKVFALGGPFSDLYGLSGQQVKKDARLASSGSLTSFRFAGECWGLEPKTAFYDWLYLNALHRQRELREQVVKYTAFTDIEFNPLKSFSCQARSCALYVALRFRELIGIAISSKDAFIELLSAYPEYSSGKRLTERPQQTKSKQGDSPTLF